MREINKAMVKVLLMKNQRILLEKKYLVKIDRD